MDEFTFATADWASDGIGRADQDCTGDLVAHIQDCAACDSYLSMLGTTLDALRGGANVSSGVVVPATGQAEDLVQLAWIHALQRVDPTVVEFHEFVGWLRGAMR